ncbi:MULTISPECIES: hypothetical protein [unclassified Streptomyces]|uniref:hypothetical protein n=1 Tax=unclassified Streptomyces TaxID=2593676 RepID=UPI0012FF4CCB|nr:MULTISPECIES: hypothetical protein [unclassified Streptomyces]
MADKAVVQEVRYALRVSERELEVIREALRKLYHSDALEWTVAADLLADLAEED